jgi:ComF family protein
MLAALGRWLLPPRCLLCAAAGHDTLDLCRACADELPWNGVACQLCALPLPALAGELAEVPRSCGACLRSPPPFVAGFAALRYAPPVDRLLPRFKFHAGLAEGRLLAQLLVRRAAPAFVAGSELLVPVPLHRERLATRGYNQALELARPLALARPHLTLAASALRRARATPPQSELDAAERRRNVRGAFDADAARVRDRAVLLLDDVVTTGATVREAAATLLAAGAREVRVIAVARAARSDGA